MKPKRPLVYIVVQLLLLGLFSTSVLGAESSVIGESTHALSLGGTLALLGAFESCTLLSFFISSWAWGRMIRREPANTLPQAAAVFGLGFGLLTLAPAGVLTWYVCGGKLAGFTVSHALAYGAMTVLSPMLVYYFAFRIQARPLTRLLAHLVFTSIINEAFHLIVSANGLPNPLFKELYALQWMGLLVTFMSWETHGWAFVERVVASEGFVAWIRSFTGEHRPQFLKMLLLWHVYFVAGEVTILNFALSYVQDLRQVAPIFNIYAQWVAQTGPIPSAVYALAVMTAVLMSVYVATMSQTRATRDTALTEQSALETSLRMTNARYAAVLQHAPFAVFQFNHNLLVDVENHKATELFRTLSTHRKPDDGSLPLPDVFLRACRRVFEGQRTWSEGELYTVTSEQSRWFQLTCEPVHDAHGACIAAVAVLDDQTERNLRETELKQVTADAEFARAAAQTASLAKSRFLANMSHEIRTPMNGLYGAIQLLSDPRLGEDKRGRILDTMKRSADSMIKLLNDILDLSKVEAGAMKLNVQPLSLRAMGNNVLNLFQAAADNKQLGLQLICDLPDDTDVVKGDELRLQQMMSNLVGNAVKFTRKGKITLQIAMMSATPGSDMAGGVYRFSVTDTGAGIGPDELKTIFNAYHQLENQLMGMSEGGTSKGTGLGLTIVKHLAELMQGTVGVDSVPGVGSTFWFEVPLRGSDE